MCAAGRKTRFVYLATMPEGRPLVSFDGVAKLDLASEPEDAALAGRVAFPPGFQGGDTVFTAADDSDAGKIGVSIKRLVSWDLL